MAKGQQRTNREKKKPKADKLKKAAPASSAFAAPMLKGAQKAPVKPGKK
jgi:hypothetical protein